jgi:hypothetical protein
MPTDPSSKLPELPTLTSADFRDRFLELTEPTQVRRYREVVGTWYPAGQEPKPQEQASLELKDPPPGISNDPDRIFGVKVSSLEDIRNMTDAQHIANIAHLPKQDREYLERKLRQGKRT